LFKKEEITEGESAWQGILDNEQLMKKLKEMQETDKRRLNIKACIEGRYIIVEKHDGLEIFPEERDMVYDSDLLAILTNVEEEAKVKVDSRFAHSVLAKIYQRSVQSCALLSCQRQSSLTLRK